jgi:hypothetical protein
VTQFGRALLALNIDIICANSPQAKGRIVPKLTLVSRLQALLHEGRLKILRELAEAERLVRELQDFRIEFTAAGHLTFNERSGKHDDLVLALAIAVWRAYGGGIASWGSLEAMRWQTMGSMPSEPRYFVGVELGQSRGPTASRWCAGLTRQDPFQSMTNQSRIMRPALSSGRKSRGV